MVWLKQQADDIAEFPLVRSIGFDEAKHRLEVRIPSKDKHYRSIAIFFAWSNDLYTAESPTIRIAYSLDDGLPGENLIEIEAFKLEEAIWVSQTNIIKVIESIDQRLNIKTTTMHKLKQIVRSLLIM